MKKSNLYGLIALMLTLVMVISVAVSANAAPTLDSAQIDKILNTTTDKAQTSNAVTEAVSKVSKSVLVVRNYQTGYNGYGTFYSWGWGYPTQNNQNTERLAGIGSGTVITEYGHVLTNYHVIEKASRVTVYDGENEYDATVINYDEPRDIAVLLVPDLTIDPVELGDSDSLQEGETAIVIGNPLGEDYMRSVTVGVVSALGREFQTRTVDKYGRRENITNTMIQTDAAINNGNSGGGMFNVLGQLMGIPSAYSHGSFYNGTDAESIGWCIPINDAKALIREALEKYDDAAVQSERKEKQETANTGNDMTDKPRLGITMTTLSDNNTAVANGLLPRGCIVREVEKNSPAMNAGIQEGDIIVEIDGVVVSDSLSLQQEILKHSSGDTVTVKLYRAETNPLEAQTLRDISDGEYLDVEVTLKVIGQPAA